MDNDDSGRIDNIYIRVISILAIGIVMPILFYSHADLRGLIRWILISTLLTFTAWEISRRVVSLLWLKYPWEVNPFMHLIMMILFLTLLSVLLGVVIYGINYLFNEIDNNYWVEMKGIHLAILLITFFTTSVYEGIFLFSKWKKTLTLSASLEKENIRSQYESLKNQVNPHFLFNSLNTLSSIIPENPGKAVEFVHKFSSLYRYVLDIKDLNSVALKEELDFVKSYVYLQKLRYADNLHVRINIDDNTLHSHIMPLSLQVLIENAIKHNEISDTYPLWIEITSANNYIIVKNNLRKASHNPDSPKTGLKNLTERYGLISNSKPFFHEEGNEFVAGIPLLLDT